MTRLLNRLLRPFGVRLVLLRAEVMVAPPWRTHREQARYVPGRYPPPGTGQQTVASAVKPARSRPTPPPPDVGFPRACPPACGEMHTYSAPCLLAPCHPLTGYHSTPHRGCILR